MASASALGALPAKSGRHGRHRHGLIDAGMFCAAHACRSPACILAGEVMPGGPDFGDRGRARSATATWIVLSAAP